MLTSGMSRRVRLVGLAFLFVFSLQVTWGAPAGTPDDSVDVAKVVADVTRALEEGDVAKAEKIQLSVLPTAERMAKDDPTLSGGLFVLVGQFYVDRDNYPAAEPHLRRAISLLDHGSAAELPQMALALLALGQVCSQKGDYAEAAQHLSRSRTLLEKELGADNPITLQARFQHAQALMQQGRLDEAETLLKQLLEAFEKAGETENPNYASFLSDLGGIHTARGEYAEAEADHLRAVAIQEKRLGPNNPWVAVSLNNLANALAAGGKHEQAEAAYRRSVEILERTVGPSDLQLAQTLQAQAAHYRTTGKLREAEATARRALAIREESLPLGSLLTLRTIAMVAQICAEQAKLDEARTLLGRAIEISTAASGPESASTLELVRSREQLASKPPDGKAPAGLTQPFAVVIRPGGASAAELPVAPDGFTWERLKGTGAALLRPAGWHILHERRGSTHRWSISAEEIRGKEGQFDTGLTLNVLRLKQRSAEEVALQALGATSKQSEVHSSWSSEQGPLKLFGMLLTDRTRPDGVPLPMQLLYVANTKTNTLYQVFFESPEPQWAQAWQKGVKMMTSFVLDEKY